MHIIFFAWVVSRRCHNEYELNNNISLSEKTRDEVSKVILQKLKNRHSKAFRNHKESFYSMISSFFSEAKMTNQHLERFNQSIQKIIQTIIRDMMSRIIQQNVAATVNVIVATTRSNSSLSAEFSQMISRTTLKSREKRWITANIEFFNFMYDNKSVLTEEFMKHAEENIYFKNVYLFLKRMKNVAKMKNAAYIRKNLFTCLRDFTLQWYIFELFENIKNLLRYDN